AEQIFREFKNPLRRKLQKAERATRIRRDEGAAALVLALNGLSLRRKHLHPPERAEAFARLHQALLQRQQCAVWLAEDRAGGPPHAGLYLAFDGRWATALVAGFDPAYGQHCGLYGLYREAIAFCAERRLTLDFDGGMDAGVGAVFRAFGGRMAPFFEVWRSSHWLADVAHVLRK
ncbi:MAG TPA: GNAT family N-acetyltransferase, partial [Saprospiraceae bacterium]|nr:GNAT family N-acetyltransferase [Saprospiraceae bacterium]